MQFAPLLDKPGQSPGSVCRSFCICQGMGTCARRALGALLLQGASLTSLDHKSVPKPPRMMGFGARIHLGGCTTLSFHTTTTNWGWRSGRGTGGQDGLPGAVLHQAKHHSGVNPKPSGSWLSTDQCLGLGTTLVTASRQETSRLVQLRS